MAKIVLSTLSSGYLTTAQLNNNFTAIQNELNSKVLYRDNPVGEDNAMLVDLDMGHNQLLNVGPGTQDSHGLNLGQAKNLLTESVNVVYNVQTSFSVTGYDDRGKLFYCTNTSPITVTILDDNAPTDGSIIYVTQGGDYYINVVAGAGVTLLSPDGNATRTKYSTIALTKVSSGEWLLMGDVGYYIV